MAYTDSLVIDPNKFKATWHSYQQRIEKALTERLPDTMLDSALLHQAMHYACLGGGKRIRASLVYACGQLVEASLEQLDPVACAIEMIHAYSLTHDDLAIMDDDDQRHGKASCHVVFGQATAILVGDGLQSLAFEILATDPKLNVPAHIRTRMLAELAQAAGAMGMVGGQALDVAAVGKTVTAEHLQIIHQYKTGALIRAAARLGLLSTSSPNEAMIEAVDQYADALGLAFQIVDDLLDQTGDSETIGKPSGSDASLNKTTWVSLYGLAQARQDADKLYQKALDSLHGLSDNTQFLRDLAGFVVRRNY